MTQVSCCYAYGSHICVRAQNQEFSSNIPVVKLVLMNQFHSTKANILDKLFKWIFTVECNKITPRMLPSLLAYHSIEIKE